MHGSSISLDQFEVNVGMQSFLSQVLVLFCKGIQRRHFLRKLFGIRRTSLITNNSGYLFLVNIFNFRWNLSSNDR